MPVPTSGRRGTAAGIALALLPFATLGLGSPFVFGAAAAFTPNASRRLATVLWTSATAYLASLIAFAATTDAASGTALDRVNAVAFGLLLIGGGIEGLVLAPFVAGAVRRAGLAATAPAFAAIEADERATAADDPALRRALRERERRHLAREILDRDPALAATLRIGRPDLDRDFADGGLVDVNAVPAEVLATLPGVTSEMAARIVRARVRTDGLRSPADLVVSADVPADVVEAVTEFLVFRQPAA